MRMISFRFPAGPSVGSVARRAAAAFALASLLAASSEARAAKPPPLPSPSVLRALEQCPSITPDAARLACYDKAAADFTRAQAAGEVVVVDRAKVREIRHQAFGLPLPSLSLFERGTDAAPDRITLTLDAASQDGAGRWRLTSTDGQTWRQTDDAVLNRVPKAGGVLTVRKGSLGSFFCGLKGEFDVRCTRDR